MRKYFKLFDLNPVNPISVFRENQEFGYGDEVRLMMKVLDRAQPDDCLKTLHLTNGNMHHAIKLVKLKKLIKVHGVTGELYLIS